jgi:transposase
VRGTKVWKSLVGVDDGTLIEAIDFDEDVEEVVVSVRPRRAGKRRCGRCQRPAPRYDAGEGRRRWRALDLGTVKVWLEADAPRVVCVEHGVVVAAVPWARHDTGHTFAFDDTVAWLAVQTSKTAVLQLMRIAWRTVGAIVTRVSADIDARVDRFAGLRRIGIDEISYKRGHKYLTIVVDHDSGRLVWAAAGRDKKTLRGFFDALGEQRCAKITHVSADAADWIADVVAERCPDAVRCADPFHVVKWSTEALDEVRREVWNTHRGAVTQRRAPTATGTARTVKRSRFALWKNPENLTDKQREQLAWVAKTDPKLYRAYLLKEGLRLVFAIKGEAGKEALDRWISWARRCRIAAFVNLQRRIVKHRAAIDAALEHGLSQGLIESTNIKIRVLTRIAFGFRSPEALIALAMLALGGHRPNLPGRTAA